jgi:sugar transferase (PEP-CTERM system associated)
MLRIGGQRVPTALLLLAAADGVLLTLGLLIATFSRFLGSHSSAITYLSSWQTAFRFALVILLCELSFYFNDLYDFRLIGSRRELLVRLLQAFGVACLALGVCYYIAPDLEFGRGIAALASPLILGLTLCWRLLVLERSHSLGSPPDRMLIVGTGPAGISLARDILSRPELKSKVVGFLDEKGENIGQSLVNPGIIGAVCDVESIVKKEKITQVVLALKERRGQTPLRQLLRLKFAGIRVDDAHGFHEQMRGRIILEHLSPSWLILSDGFQKSSLLVWTKRVLDVVGSLVALILCLPLFGAVAAAIWLETGAPVLYRQDRTGLHGRTFGILKFRSMTNKAETDGPRWATDGDHRITRVGRWIRKYRVDELPQFINVLRGEMSIVGPRPERPEFVSMLEEQIPFYALRHWVRPGITGWAQVRYQYGASVEDSKIKLELDLFYIKHLSIMLDLAVLFETLKVMVSGRGAK